jgi:enamine deaminase RidA (YjgF/YER057c/UK114 family)
MTIAARLKELSIEIPPAPAPVATYVPYVVVGKLVFIAGQGAFKGKQLLYVGKVGQEVSEQDAYQSARLCALNCLAQLQAAVGSLDKVRRIVRVGGFVNCGPGFAAHPQVINGASDVFVEIFGDKGRHARIAVGMANLPMDTSVEVELVAAIE